MPIHLTPDQARRLGIRPSAGVAAEPVTGAATPPAAARRRRRTQPYHTVCDTCGEAFTTQAAETRHLDTTRHPNYQLVFELDAP